jgi:hypothetical protein
MGDWYSFTSPEVAERKPGRLRSALLRLVAVICR